MRVDNDDYARPSGSEKNHQPEITDEAGAVEKLEEDMSEGFLKQYISPLLICDTITSEATEEAMEDIFDRCQVLVLDHEDLHADEYAIEIVENYMEDDIDLILSFGTGVIHDISKYIAYHYNIPFVVLPTKDDRAEFGTSAAYILINGEKKEVPALSPLAVYADSDIIKLVSKAANANKA